MTQIYQPRHGTRHGPRHGTDNFGDFEEFNFAQPESQSFPASLAELAALGWSTNVAGAWAMQETGASSTLADFSGNGITLSRIVGAGATTSFVGQRAVGLFDGQRFDNQRAIEFVPSAGVAGWGAASGTALDYDYTLTQKWSQFVVFRINTPTVVGGIMNKGPFPDGYGIYYSGSNQIIASVGDGVNSGGQSVAGDFADGAWHWAYARFDPTTDTVYMDTDLGGAVNSTTMGPVGSSANAGTFRFGQWEAAALAFGGQVRGGIVWNDIDTPVAAINAWWRQGRVPSGITYSRASKFSAPVADSSIFGDVLATWASGQFGLEYSALTSTNPLKLGMAVDTATTNLVPNTDLNDNTVWAESPGTRTKNHADSPRGFREAILHTKSNATDRVVDAGTGAAVTAAAAYNASVWCRWNGAGTAPELRVYRADVSTLIGTASATLADGRWHRLSLTFTAPATEAARLSISGAAAASTTGSAWFFGPQITTGDYAKPWVGTTSAAASSVAVVARMSVPGLTSDTGTIKVWATARAANSASNRVIFSAVATAGAVTNERLMYVSSSSPSLALYDGSTQALQAGTTPDLATVEGAFVGQWDAARPLSWSKRINRTPTATGLPATENSALPAATAATEVYIGGRGNGGEQLGGIVSKVRVWRRVALEA